MTDNVESWHADIFIEDANLDGLCEICEDEGWCKILGYSDVVDGVLQWVPAKIEGLHILRVASFFDDDEDDHHATCIGERIETKGFGRVVRMSFGMEYVSIDEDAEIIDLLVETEDPVRLNRAVNSTGAYMPSSPPDCIMEDGLYVMVTHGSPDWATSEIHRMGLGKVLRKRVSRGY